jgi:Tfp pilus assembly protein PilO
MEKLKQWIALTLVGALGILAVGWFLLVSPKRGEAAEIRAQAQSQLSANALLQTQIDVLKAQAKELPEQQATLADVAAKIPGSTALPELVRALSDVSERAGVDLVSITPGPPAVVAAPAAATAAPADGQTTTEGVPTTATAPAVGPAGQLASIPVSLSVVGGYFEMATFLSGLERLPRAFRVNELSLAPGLSPTETAAAGSTAATDGTRLTTTINGYVYMTAGATPTVSSPAAAADPATAVTPPVAQD